MNWKWQSAGISKVLFPYRFQRWNCSSVLCLHFELHRCYQTQLKAHEKVMLITTFNSFTKICHVNDGKQSSVFSFCNGFNQEHLLWSQNYTTVKPPEECECVLCSHILVIRGSKQSAQCWCDRNLCGWYPWIIPWLLPSWAMLLPSGSARHVRIQSEGENQKLVDTSDKLCVTLLTWFAYQMTENTAMF